MKIDIDDNADDAAIEKLAAEKVGVTRLKIDQNEAEMKSAEVLKKDIPAILVDRFKRKGRIRTSNGQLILCTGPECTSPQDQRISNRTLIIPEEGEEIVLLGPPSVRLIRSII